MSGEKNLPATDKKIEDARKKGQVAVGKDLKIVGTLMLGYTIIFWMLPTYKRELNELLEVIISAGMTRDFAWSPAIFSSAVWSFFLITAPVVAGCIVANLLMTWAQIGFLVSPEAATPSFKKFNAVDNIKQMFSKKSLLQLLLSVAKVMIISFIVFLVFKGAMSDMVYSYRGGIDELYRIMAWVLKKIVFMTLGVFIVIAILDWVIEKANLMKKLRMDHKELKDEHKESFGNPEILRHRKQEHFNILNSSLSRVDQSKVIVANPTHISVALDYEPGVHDIPFIVAMGEDQDALDIRKKATELGIPVIVNIELARSLYRECGEGEYVKKEHLELAAQVFRAVFQLKNEAQS